MNRRVLLVDDEAFVLASLQRSLRGKFDIITASSGADGLLKVKIGPAFAVIVSDFQMPEMNGIEFLVACRAIAPDAVKIMLTGQADMRVAIEAVNQGNIYQFLTKPCPPDHLEGVLNSALEHFRLVESEKELLDKTLKGCIKVLFDVLALTNPTAFGQAVRIRNLARDVAERAGVNNAWEVELTALLSHLGCITVPEEILVRKQRMEKLSVQELELYSSHIRIGSRLVANIPRLETISEAISFQNRRFDGSDYPGVSMAGSDIPILSRLLKVLIDYDELTAIGMSSEKAIERMRQRQGWYDPQLFVSLENQIMSANGDMVIRLVTLEELADGMIAEEDIVDSRDRVVIAARMEINDIAIQQLKNYNRVAKITQPIKVKTKQ